MRERYAKIEKYLKGRRADEERLSGIVTEENELDQAIENIIGMTEADEEDHTAKSCS